MNNTVMAAPAPMRFCCTPRSKIAYVMMYVDRLGLPSVNMSTVSKACSHSGGTVRMPIGKMPGLDPEHVFTLRGQEKRRTVSRFLAVAGAAGEPLSL